jgi:two-component system sensor histidine kinase ChiS
MQGSAYRMPYLILFEGTSFIPFFAAGFASALLLAALTVRLYLFFRPESSAAERKQRTGPVFSIAVIALTLAFPVLTGNAKVLVSVSAVQFAGFLAFESFFIFRLLKRSFPADAGRFLPLLLIVFAAAFLGPLMENAVPFMTIGAPFMAACFSFILLPLCFFLLALSSKKCQTLNPFIFGALIYLVLGVSFFLPPAAGGPARFAALLMYLCAEHAFFGRRIQQAAAAQPPAGREPGPAAAEEDLEELAVDEEGAELTRAVKQFDGVTPFIPHEFLALLNKESIEDLKLGDHAKQEMTIFFSDIRQFTDLSEKLTPEESFAFINSYLSRIVPEITKNGGFVDKYIGDAILALFPEKDGPDMAVRTAIAIQDRILEYNAHRAKCGYSPLAMGIGVHTGALMLGVVGVANRMQNTVVSDAVNLASRLESITKVFGVSLAISEATFKKLSDPGSYKYRFIGKVRVKGKSAPVSVFEIFDGINPVVQKRKIEANMFFEQGMFHYYQKNYSEALMSFRKVREILPDDGASAFYMDNCLSKLKSL